MWYEPSHGCIGREKQRAYTAHIYENKDSYSPCILLHRARGRKAVPLTEFASMWQERLEEVRITKHRIDLLPGARPVFSQPYRTGPEVRKVIRENIDDLLQKGCIEPAQTEWTSPGVLVPKQDGSLRFCVDYRRLNALTVKNSYPLPRMYYCLDTFGISQYFATLDCNSGCW